MRIGKCFHRRPSDALSVERQLNSITAYFRTPYCRSPWFMVRDISFGNSIFVSIRMPHWGLNFINIPERAVTIGPVIWAWDVAFHFTQLIHWLIWWWICDLLKCWIISIILAHTYPEILFSPAAKWRKIAANCHYMHKHLYQISRLQFATACGHWLLSLRIIFNP